MRVSTRNFDVTARRKSPRRTAHSRLIFVQENPVLLENLLEYLRNGISPPSAATEHLRNPSQPRLSLALPTSWEATSVGKNVPRSFGWTSRAC